MTIQITRPKANRALLGLAAVAPTIIAGVLGSISTRPAIPVWYASLNKPFFTPPNWVFAPAWTILYLMMAYAFWRILILPASQPGRRAAIVAFLVQITFNALWSIAFFGLRSPAAGLAVVLVFWLAIAVTIAKFRPLDAVAAWLLAPYLAWTTFAAALNIGVFALNR